MTPDDFTIYNKSLINLVNGMFKDFNISTFLTEEAYKKYASSEDGCLRHSKLSLSDIAKFLMQPRTETMEVEKQVFLELIHRDIDVTKEDIIERRTNLLSSAFRDFNIKMSNLYYAEEFPSINSRPIIAFDGTMVSLQQTPELMEEFGGHPSRNKIGAPLSRSEILCDTETETIIDAEFGKFTSDEGSMAVSMLRRMPQSLKERHPIAIFDRKYCGFRIMYACLRANTDFVIRAKRNFSKETDDFFASKDEVRKIKLSPRKQSVKRHLKKYPDEEFGEDVEVWLCRSYDGEEPVVLICSFEISKEQGLKLYPLRWKAESAIDSLKNLFQIEIFSGRRPEVVRQDFYARLIAYNIFYMCLHAATLMCLKQEEKKGIKASRKHKYAYRLNANASLHKFKEVLPSLFYMFDTESTLLNLIKFMTKFFEPIRPNRHLARKFRAIKLFGKYITVQNYRRAI